MLLTPLNCDSNSNAAVISSSSKKTSKEAQVYKIFKNVYMIILLMAGGCMLSRIPRCLEATAGWRFEWR